ncbi:MAG TPA: hydroxymethylbilane synthase [Allosphingosinicella sp.]|jgi:hydroxymethylbilane synthase
MQSVLRLGTRGSPLALVQARLVATALRDAHGWGPELIEIEPIATSGDQLRDRPISEMGGKALWTKELDVALLEGRIDLAVHSMKDVETIRPAEIALVAMLERADVCDRLVGAPSLAALPEGARVGTSSPRRAAQLLARRPDLNIVHFRGNVETRLRKIKMGEVDATLLAAAGLDRLGRSDCGILLDDVLPAPAQGAIGVEVRSADRRVRALLAAIDHRPTHLCVAAERRLLEGLGGSCRSPVAALATLDGDRIRLRAEILTEDGGEVERCDRTFASDDSSAPLELARGMLEAAAPRLRALFNP